MRFFEALGEDLDARWRAQGYREEGFPALAAAALREHNAPAHVDPAQIIEWLLEAQRLPAQGLRAADYTATLFATERFLIDVNYWVDGTTKIHDHCSWGAVQVLAGANVETEYTFTETERITSYLARGELSVREITLQQTGDVREIPLGREFIHAVFHLTRPSVSIVIFTRSPLHYATNFSYLSPGFAYVDTFQEQRLVRQLGALDVLARTQPAEYEAAVARFVGRSDAMYAFRALLHAYQQLDDASFARLLGAARVSHAGHQGAGSPTASQSPRTGLAELWSDVFRERQRQDNITARRELVHAPDHRFFLAVLQSAPCRADILRLVRERAPDRDPVETIVTWVAELASIPVTGAAGPTAIGVPFDDVGLSVLRALLHGRTASGVLEMLKDEFDGDAVDSQQGAVLDLIAAFYHSDLFRPLLPSREPATLQ